MSESAPREALESAVEMLGLALDSQSLERLERYSELVRKWQRIVNLTGGGAPERFVREHLVDCLTLLPHLLPGMVVDVGSGAGLPGLVIAITRPQTPVILVEPRQKRARFLTQVAIELGVEHVEVQARRVESLQLPASPRYVVSRAFASLEQFVRLTSHLAGPGLERVAMKSALDRADLAAAESLAGKARVVPLSVPGFEQRNLVFFEHPRASAGDKTDMT